MIDSVTVKQVYNGDGSTTNFPFSFPFIASTDVKVAIYVVATEQETQLTSDYYVDSVGHKVVYPGYPPGEAPPLSQQPGPLPAGQRLVIYRSTPISQLKDLGDKYPLPFIEEMVDKNTMILQEQGEKLDRAVLVDMGGGITPQDVSYDIKHLKEYKDEAYASKVAAANSATAAANSATSAANSATTAGNYKASVESTVNTFNATVQNAVNNAVVAGTAAANQAAATASGYAAAAQGYLTSTQEAAADFSQQGQSILASAAQYATQAAQDAAGIHASAIPAWDPETVYSYPDVVAYTNGGTYRCIGENVPAGTAPTTSPVWVRITEVNGDDFFEIDLQGGLQPRIYPTYSQSFDLDENGAIMPRGTDTEITVAAVSVAEAAAQTASEKAQDASDSASAAAGSASSAHDDAVAAAGSLSQINAALENATLIELDQDDAITTKNKEE